jgi:hypothetical protein
MGIRNKEKGRNHYQNTKGKEKWICVWHVRGAMSVQSDGYVIIHVFTAIPFLLYTSMGLVIVGCMPVTIQLSQGLTKASPPSNYLHFCHHYPLDQPSLGYP